MGSCAIEDTALEQATMEAKGLAPLAGIEVIAESPVGSRIDDGHTPEDDPPVVPIVEFPRETSSPRSSGILSQAQ